LKALLLALLLAGSFAAAADIDADRFAEAQRRLAEKQRAAATRPASPPAVAVKSPATVPTSQPVFKPLPVPDWKAFQAAAEATGTSAEEKRNAGTWVQREMAAIVAHNGDVELREKILNAPILPNRQFDGNPTGDGWGFRSAKAKAEWVADQEKRILKQRSELAELDRLRPGAFSRNVEGKKLVKIPESAKWDGPPIRDGIAPAAPSKE
jgi:hypothetical protein